jgi:amidophosphoribosyltransferase
VFAQINDRVNEEMAAHPEYADNVALQKQIFHVGNCFRHVRYGTFGKIVSRVFILFYVRTTGCTGIDLAGGNMTNVKELFKVSWN